MSRWICMLALTIFGGAAGAESLLVNHVNIIDPATGAVHSDHAIVIDQGRIAHVGAAGGIHAGQTTEIDGQGGWVIPGLAEMHAHVPSKGPGEQYARDVLTLYLANGVTTIRGMLGEPWHLELRQMLASGAWRGPRLVTSGPSFNGRTVSSPEQGAAQVREQAEAGYDFLKIHPGLSRAEFQAIAAAATELGIPVAGHVSFETGLEAALEARMASIDHLDSYAQAMLNPSSSLRGVAPQWFGLNLGRDLDPHRAGELARATAAAGVWNVPTQSLFETTAGEEAVADLMARPGMKYLSEGLAGRWRQSVEDIRARAPAADRQRFLQARRALILALQQEDAGLLLGSDAPQIMNVPGFSAHEELRYLVAAGLTPLQALQSGTVNVATYFDFEDQGRVAPGFVADFLLLRDNPLEDIAHTAGIEGVMRGGRWYDRAALDQMLEDIEKRGL